MRAMETNNLIFLALVAVAIVVVFKFVYWVLTLRRVVATNEVHIVQSAKLTKSYGKDTEHGNTYYEWPSWIPIFGVSKIILPVSVFDLDLNAYEAYDKGRLPFVVDVKSFFRITDSNVAAQRVASFQELKDQLHAIVQGAVRTILASSDIESIMQGRSVYGEQFTKEVSEQLSNWGVNTVKNIELMDIRDSKESHVIQNIMSKKKSAIEMESRTVVAENMRKAEIAEIEAKREIDMQNQQALETVGRRTAEKEKAVGIANEQAQQEITEQQKTTKEKQMAVVKVAEVKQAEITKEVTLVQAQQQKETSVIRAEGEKQQTVLIAEGRLEEQKRHAEGITVTGAAQAEAKKLMELAPVQAQIALAQEIGDNKGYQEYLVTIRQVEANEKIGVEQSQALKAADIKIISNAGDPVSGMGSVMDLFTSKGGTNVAGMLEALAQSKNGKALLDKFGVKDTEPTN
jgi:flotillin